MERNEIIRTLRGFIEMNRDRYEIVRIGVFGSAARDNMNEQSDIDVVVELGKPDLFYLIGIKQDLEEKFHRPVDIQKKAKGMRDIISHHYFETDAEVIYDVCKNHIPELVQTINKMVRELS
jgi:predicted nucleotidyltransferase